MARGGTDMLRLALALILLMALPAKAEETLVAGLSQNFVAITATFVGSEILVFGAVKREAPAPDTGDLNVIVVIEGPSYPLVVRRKSHRFGIWINTAALEVEAAPSFYAIATSAPLSEAILEAEDLRHHITIPQSIRVADEAGAAEYVAEFTAAVIRIRTEQGLYKIQEGAVTLSEDTLFNTSISLPSNLTEGEYYARIYLTRGGKVIAEHVAMIDVRKVGIERWIYNLAHERPLIYGLLSLFIAIAAGWGASALFRVILRT